MSNKIILCALMLLSSFSAVSQKPTLLFVIERGWEDTTQIHAIPFVMFSNGKYSEVPLCIPGATSKGDIAECDRAKKNVLPLITAGNKLYILNNGTQTGTSTILKSSKFEIGGMEFFTGLLPEHPRVKILTSNAKIGITKPAKETKSRPVLKARKDPEGYVLKDELMTKVDIDGDGTSELIYACMDYEGVFYRIYSFKKNKWAMVFEGGYQGV